MFITLDTSQFKKIDEYESIYSVNPSYLRINHASRYTEEKKGYTVDKNKKYDWDGIKNKIKAIIGGEGNDYGKDYMKIKFNSDDELPLNKPLKFHAMTLIIRCF